MKNRKSNIAGVMDSYGGLRVVVTERWRMKHHQRHDELLFIVPNFRIAEPVPWERIPEVVARVESYIAWFIASRNDPDFHNQEHIKLYKLRCLEHPHSKRATNLEHIVET